MISVDDAKARLIALSIPLPIETMALNDAIGRWAAEDVISKRTQPASDLSAMDGYAVAYNGQHVSWHIIGESAAGARFLGTVGQGEAARIFTGAALPEGTDTVIIQEDVQRTSDTMSLNDDVVLRQGQHVRRAGGDFRMDDILIAGGERLTAARIAVAAMGGHGTLDVRRTPTIEILSTGNELVQPGAAVGEDQIPNSNAVMLSTMLRDMPCKVISGAIIPDCLDALTEAIRGSDADILVTCGGASVGDHDLVQPALIKSGAEIDFWKVAMRPGKPLMAGRRGSQLVLGLPGNPVSAFVTATLFLRPMIAAMMGAKNPVTAPISAILGTDLPPVGNRTDHVRARLEGGTVFPVGLNDSSALASLASANALIIRQVSAQPAKAGEIVSILMIA
jgi:molybdopterin molybdotransferase